MDEKLLMIENILDLKLEIKKNFFMKTEFIDDELEKTFLKSQNPINKINVLFSDIMMIGGYLVSLLYIFFIFYRPIFVFSCLSFKFLTIIAMIITKRIDEIKHRKVIFFLGHLQIIFLGLSLNTKSIIISLFFNTNENDNHDEIIRLTIYEFLTTNIFLLVKLDAYWMHNLGYFLLNFIGIIIGHVKSNKNHFYALEALTSFLVYLIFFVLRKLWDIRIRISFGEKYKYQILFKYANDFLSGLNGYHIIIKEDKFFSFNRKFFDELITDTIISDITMFEDENDPTTNQELNNFNFNHFNSQKNILKGNNPFENKKINSNNIKNCSYEKNVNLSKMKMSNSFNIEKEVGIINNKNFNSISPIQIETKDITEKKLMKLSERKENLDISSVLKNSFISGNQINLENKISFNLNLNIIKDSSSKNSKKNITENMVKTTKLGIEQENLIDDNEKQKAKIHTKNNLNNADCELKIIYFLKKLKKIKEINNHNKYDSEFNKFIGKSLYEILLLKKISKSVKNTEIVDNMGILNDNSQDILNYKTKNLDEHALNLNKKSLISNFSEENHKESVKIKYLGIFKINLKKIKQSENCNFYEYNFFDVFLRKISIEKNEFIKDFTFYDVTELIHNKQRIIDEQLIKEKIFAKIIHEFKTPLNSVVGLIAMLKKSYKNNRDLYETKLHDKQIEKKYSYNSKSEEAEDEFIIQLNLVKNLSNHLMFLISDILNYSNFSQNNQISLYEGNIDLNQVLTFCYKILKTLLYCNKNKNENIKAILKIDEELENCEIVADEFRLKQILLNLISNAVKFTSKGAIHIEAKLIYFNYYEFNRMFNSKKTKEEFEHNDKYFNLSNKIFFNEETKENERILENSLEKILQIKVVDSGIGIKDEDKHKIFCDFTAINSNIENSIGTGLGLSICKSICEKMNFKIFYESKYNEGSTFMILIPSFKVLLRSLKTNYNIQIHDSDNQRNVYIQNKNSLHKSQNISFSKTPNGINIYENCLQASKSNDIKSKKNQIFKNKTKANSGFYKLRAEEDSEDQIDQKSNIKNIFKNQIFSRNSQKELKYNMTIIKKRIKVSNSDISCDKTTLFLSPRLEKMKICEPSSFDETSNLSRCYMTKFERIKTNFSNIFSVSNPRKKLSQCLSDKSLTKFVSNQSDIVLLADDNHIINQSNKNILVQIFKETSLNLEIVLCNDGIELIKSILNDKFKGRIKYIITDENMELLNGSDAIKIIRFFEMKKICDKIYIISLTCHEDKNMTKYLIDAGANNVITKPLIKSSLIKFFKI